MSKDLSKEEWDELFQPLTQKEKSLSWDANWDPSFEGLAIVTRQFRFKRVNTQFCEILGVSESELVGYKFQDITPPPVKQLDENNAKLVIARVMECYILDKSYEFGEGENRRFVHVTLIAKGVFDEDGEFLHFIAKIMEKETVSDAQDQKLTKDQEHLVDEINKDAVFVFTLNKKTAISAIGAGITAGVLGVLKALGII